LLNREGEVGVFSGQFLVNDRESVQFMINVGFILGIKEDLEMPRVVELVSDASADDIGGEDEVLQDGVVHGGESPAPRSLLPLDVVFPGGLGNDLSLGDDDDMLAAEFLLEFADQTGLDLVIRGKEGIGDEDDDGLLVAFDGDFAGPAEV